MSEFDFIYRVASDVVEPFLYHGTSRFNLNTILNRDKGLLRSPSYWGTEEIAGYYATTFADEGIVLRVPLTRFNQKLLKPDMNSIAEPITMHIEYDEHEVGELWEKCKGTWKDSYRIVGSVVYNGPIKITKADVYLEGIYDSE